MATVRKRKWTHKGVEKEAWVVSYTDQDGTRRLKTFEKKKEADAYRQQVESEIAGGTHTALSQTAIVSDAIDIYMEELKRKRRIGDLTAGSLVDYETCLKRFKVKFGARKLSTLEHADFIEWVKDLRDQKYSGSTVGNTINAASGFMDFAVSKKWVKINVARVQRLKMPKRSKRANIPSKTDISTLLSGMVLRGPRDDMNSFINRIVFVVLGLFGGFRPGEIFGLHWEDIDADRMVINVRRTATRYDGIKSPKTEAGVRCVPMTMPMLKALEMRARFLDAEAAAMEDISKSQSTSEVGARRNRLFSRGHAADVRGRTGLVLTNRNGGYYANEAGPVLWNPLMKRIGLWDDESDLPKFTMHALRHAAVSLFIERGLPAMNLKSMIGHSSVNTTLGVYAHLFPEDTRIADVAHMVASDFENDTPLLEAVALGRQALDATRARHEIATI